MSTSNAPAKPPLLNSSSHVMTVQVKGCCTFFQPCKGQVLAKQPRRRSTPQTTPAIPPEVRALLGPPPITSTEDADAYAQLEVGLAAAIRPNDAIEWIWLRDAVDLIWEARRLRRAKVAAFAVSRAYSLQQLISTKVDARIAKLSTDELGSAHLLLALEERGIILPPEAITALGDPAKALVDLQAKASAEAEGELAQLMIESNAYRRCLPDLERFDRLITIADVRRDTIQRDLYRRREILARRSSSPYEPVIDMEFEE